MEGSAVPPLSGVSLLLSSISFPTSSSCLVGSQTDYLLLDGLLLFFELTPLEGDSLPALQPLDCCL